MDESQLLKGILEGCVLSVISEGETYGYEILTRLEKCGFDTLLEGTLYPVLTRLEMRFILNIMRLIMIFDVIIIIPDVINTSNTNNEKQSDSMNPQ